MNIEIISSLPDTPTAELTALTSRGVKAVEINESGHLIFTLTDNSRADLGGIPIITAQTVSYQSGVSGAEPPTGEWTAGIPETPQGQYLWTRTVFSYMDGEDVTEYSVSRMGLDGSGSVTSVNGKSPNSSGNVSLVAPDVGAAEREHSHDISHVTGLSVALSGKAAAAHGHEMTDVAGLSAALSPAAIGAEKQRLQFINTSVAPAAFAPDGTYENFPFRASIALAGVQATMTPEVVLSVADAMGGNFAPVSRCYDGGIYIYAAEAPAAAMNIPTIICWKAVG